MPHDSDHELRTIQYGIDELVALYPTNCTQ